MKPERCATPAPIVQRIGGIDGLRAVSILIVLFGHGSSSRDSPTLLTPMQNMGIVGVELFFAISGFVITLLLLREWQRDGGVCLKQFWMRRALRILPPFFAVSAGLWLAASFGVMQWWWGSFFGAVTFTKNLPIFNGDWFFGHIWSLAVEEQFYLFWPLLFTWLMVRKRVSLALLMLVLASPVFAVLCTKQLTVLQNLLPFLPYLATGALLATLLQPQGRTFFSSYTRLLPHRAALLWILTLTAIGVAYLRHNQLWADITVPLNGLLMPFTIFFILLESTGHEGLLQQTLDSAPLRALGRVSYSVYLWQQLFLGPPDVYSAPWFWSQWPQNIFAGIFCGTLLYFIIEVPCARLRSRLGRSKRLPKRANDAQPWPQMASAIRRQANVSLDGDSR
jgi:peptidoglycan/LPS O-acetylase OafA/YrhL